jgi:uncharacterized membrane protein YfcA
MDVFELMKIGGVMLVGSLIQSSSGFGFGLFAVPLFLFMGFSLPDTVIMVVIGSAVQKITAVSYLWKAADWKGHAPYMIVGLLTLPLGVYCMYRVSFLSQPAVKQVIGAVILLLLTLQWKGLIKSKEKVAAAWGYTAGFFSGFLNGLANIGGPPLVLWILAHRWPNEKMRVTPIAFSLIFVPFQVLFMALMFGSALWSPLLNALLLTPSVLLGTWLGLKIGKNISKQHLQIYMRVLLLFIALSAIAGPFLSNA